MTTINTSSPLASYLASAGKATTATTATTAKPINTFFSNFPHSNFFSS